TDAFKLQDLRRARCDQANSDPSCDNGELRVNSRGACDHIQGSSLFERQSFDGAHQCRALFVRDEHEGLASNLRKGNLLAERKRMIDRESCDKRVAPKRMEGDVPVSDRRM